MTFGLFQQGKPVGIESIVVGGGRGSCSPTVQPLGLRFFLESRVVYTLSNN